MRKKSKVEQDEIKYVQVKGRTFTNVRNISKFQKCTRANCKYYFDCKENGVFRLLDCRDVANRIIGNYSFITGVFVFLVVLFFYYILKQSIFKTIAFSILSIVALDILCTAFEWCVSKIRENTLYNKLLRMEKKREDEKTIKKMEERLRKEYYDDINLAKVSYTSLKSLLSKTDWGISKSNISKIVKSLKDILEILEENPLMYSKVAFIFEVQLPEVYNVLNVYALLFKNGIVIDEQGEILNKYVEKFLLTVEKIQKELMVISNPEEITSNDENGDN